MANMHDDSISHKKVMLYHGALGVLEPVPMNDIGPQKIRALVYYMNWRNLYNSLLMCYFISWRYNDMANIVNAVTGWGTSMWELMKVGERITTMGRVFNIREGLTHKDDWLPQRFFQPHTSGALSQTALDEGELKNALQLYYGMMGWNEKGVPSNVKLEELEIGWTVNL